MNTKNVVVSATLLACVAFAVTVSAQNTSTAFTFTLDGIGAGFRSTSVGMDVTYKVDQAPRRQTLGRWNDPRPDSRRFLHRGVC